MTKVTNVTSWIFDLFWTINIVNDADNGRIIEFLLWYVLNHVVVFARLIQKGTKNTYISNIWCKNCLLQKTVEKSIFWIHNQKIMDLKLPNFVSWRVDVIIDDWRLSRLRTNYAVITTLTSGHVISLTSRHVTKYVSSSISPLSLNSITMAPTKVFKYLLAP